MQNGNRNFADMTYFCGYSDQSHFIRENRRYLRTYFGKIGEDTTRVFRFVCLALLNVSFLLSEGAAIC